MILKNDYRSIVKDEKGVIVKTFKPGHQLNTKNIYNKKWKDVVNDFGHLYGHFPKIIECTSTKMIVEKVLGKNFNEIRQESYKTTLEEQARCLKKLQFLYFRFISNLLEYNVNNDTMLSHSDLNYNNMYVANDKLVCIDLDAVKLNRFPVETTFISMPLTVFQLDAESLNYHYTGQMHMDKGKHEN